MLYRIIRLLFLLILLWKALVVCAHKVDYVSYHFYDRVVNPDKTLRIPEKELKFWLPVDWPNPVNVDDDRDKCKGHFYMFANNLRDEYYCYNLPKFPAFEIRTRVSMVDRANQIWGCGTPRGCDSYMKPSSCDMELDLKIKDSPVEPFSYMLSANVDNLPKDATLEMKLPYLPENYTVGEHENFNDCFRTSCDGGQWCDHMHRYPHDEHTDYGRCFKVPTFPDSNEGPRIPVLRGFSLFPCSKNEDCYCEYCDPEEIMRCDKTTGWTFKKSYTKEKHDGICVKAHPVGFTFAETYTHLNSDVVYEERRKYFPADFTGLGQKVMKKCSSNKDCADGQFCDGVLDSVSNSVKSGRSHCYTIPIDTVFRETTKAVISPDVSGLKLCNVASDCPLGSFCNSLAGEKYVEWNETSYMKDVYNGFCLRAGNCTVNEFNEAFKWEFGTSPSDEKVSCDSDFDCARTRDTSDTTYQGYCALKNVLQNVNLCCHREVSPCKYGKIVEAGKRCQKNVSAAFFSQGGFAECNGGLDKMREQERESDKWCDEENHQCCKNPTANNIQYCPDEQTPLFNEPKCQNYNESLPNSGECVGRSGAICKLGHCCPDVKLGSRGQVIRNKFSYRTNFPCTPGTPPPVFHGGYCEPESGKVIMHGKFSLKLEPFRPANWFVRSKCFDDSDCSKDNSTICIHENEWDRDCYFNPERDLPLHPIWIIFIIVIIGLVTVAIASGLCVWKIWRDNRQGTVKPLENGQTKSTSQTTGTPKSNT